MNKNKITQSVARDTLRAIGCTLTSRNGEYLVRIKGSPSGYGYYTNDLTDAIDTARSMVRTNSPTKI